MELAERIIEMAILGAFGLVMLAIVALLVVFIINVIKDW